MTVLFLISIASLFIFLIFSVIIYHALNSIRENQPKENPTTKISIIVAVKNEQDKISNLLESFSKLDYPKEYFEIIIVDDNSIDDTNLIVKSYSKKIPNLRIIFAADKKIPAKKGTLEIGIKNAKFDYVVLTDADCVIPVDWLKYFSYKFENGSQFVFGNIVYTNTKKTFAGYFQQFENFRSKVLYFAAAKLNFPYSAGGANFGFRKDAFYKLGGYSTISKTFSGDDDLLIQMASKHRMKIDFLIEQNATVRTAASTNFNEIINRKARHTSASYFYSGKSKLLLGFWHFANLSSVSTIFFSPINSIFLFPFLVKMIIDALFVAQFAELFGYRFNVFQSIVFQILYEATIIINFFNGFRFIRRWK
ncbi:MAG: glycosyltransferase [Ignavibacteriales bacterium]